MGALREGVLCVKINNLITSYRLSCYYECELLRKDGNTSMYDIRGSDRHISVMYGTEV